MIVLISIWVLCVVFCWVGFMRFNPPPEFAELYKSHPVGMAVGSAVLVLVTAPILVLLGIVSACRELAR